jgi:hypothetical protein
LLSEHLVTDENPAGDIAAVSIRADGGGDRTGLAGSVDLIGPEEPPTP